MDEVPLFHWYLALSVQPGLQSFLPDWRVHFDECVRFFFNLVLVSFWYVAELANPRQGMPTLAAHFTRDLPKNTPLFVTNIKLQKLNNRICISSEGGQNRAGSSETLAAWMVPARQGKVNLEEMPQMAVVQGYSLVLIVLWLGNRVVK